MTLEEILVQVQMGGLSPEAAGKLIRQDGYKEMDYAKLDTGRKARTGFAEVIYCSNKADAHLLKIFERLYMEEGEVLGTRASQAQYELVKEKFPEVQYDPVSRILKIEKPDKIHEGEDHTGESIGLIRFTPWEAVVVAADVAMKSADVQIGFMDRFCGSLIITGGLSQVQTAVEEVVRFFDRELGFKTCAVHRS